MMKFGKMQMCPESWPLGGAIPYLYISIIIAFSARN
jgi:hypothetical protein